MLWPTAHSTDGSSLYTDQADDLFMDVTYSLSSSAAGAYDMIC